MTLSIQNNNPGNLRGKSGDFRIFQTPEDGLNAMKRDLILKLSGNSKAMAGKDPTLANVLSTWAPPSENDTQAYIDAVSQKTGINPNDTLNTDQVDALMPAMIEHEGGPEATKYFGTSSSQTMNTAQMSPKTFNLELPDGTVLQDIPEGTTKEQVMDKLKANGYDIGQLEEKPKPSIQAPEPEKGIVDRAAEDLTNRGQNMRDVISKAQNGDKPWAQVPLDLAGQSAGLMSDLSGQYLNSAFHALPDGWQQAAKKGAQNAVSGLSAIPLGDGQNTVGSVANSALQRYQDFAQNNPNAADALSDIANLGGVLAGTTSNPATRSAGAAVSALGEGAGSVAKGAVNVAGRAAGAVAPKIDEGLADVAKLAREQKYPIPLSFDQITNSKAVKNVQKVSQELPFSGQSGFRDKQLSAWQRNLLDTVGVDGDKVTPKVMDKAFTDVGAQFDKLGAGKTFQFGQDFKEKVSSIRSEAESLYTKDALGNFDSAVNKVLSNADKDGYISGEKLGSLRSQVNTLARKAKNPETQELLHDLENSVIDVMTAGDDVAKGELSDAKQKYKNLLAIEPIAAKSKGGNISPAQLASRVSKIYGRQYTRGKAGQIGDLARIGYELLPELGGSDTVQKAIYASAGALGGAGGALANLPTTAAVLTGNRALQGLNRSQGLIDSAIKKSDSALMRLEKSKQVAKKK